MDTNIMVVEQRKQQAAARLGVEINQVQAIRLELGKMREAGLLIDLDIHGVSMFSVRVKYDELGIDANDVRSERLRTGSKDLFPIHTKKLRSLEARARQNLEKYSYRVSAFGQWQWLPWTAYESFKQTHDAIVAEMDAVKADAIAKWDEVAEKNRQYFASVARRAWRDMISHYDYGSDVVIITTDGVKFERHEQERFVSLVAERAVSKMPSKERIAAEVKIDYRTSILYNEAEITAEAAALAQAEASQVEAQVERERAYQELFGVQSEKREVQAREQARIEAMKRAELEHARSQLAQMGSPLQEALDMLRANVYDAVSTTLASLRKNDGFKGRASSKVAELYGYWQSMNANLLDDAELDASLQDLQALMQTYQGSDQAIKGTQIGDIEAQLVSIQAMTAKSVEAIRAGSESRASALEF